MADIETISIVLKEIQAAYPNWKADEDTVKVWTVYLIDLDDDLLITAVRKFISSSLHAFPPSIAEIRTEASSLELLIDGVPSAYEAWREVQLATKPSQTFHHCDVSIDRRGWIMVDNPPYKWSHPMVEKCARRFGWPKFPNNENESIDRAHFVKAYEAMVNEDKRIFTQLPQVSEYVESNQSKLLEDDKRSAFDTGERHEVDRQINRLARPRYSI